MKRTLVRARGKVLRVAVSAQMLLAPAQFLVRAGALAAQARPGVTAEEARRARAAAVEFTERLLRARDLKPVVGEMFVADFARRHVAQEASRGGGRGDFMFEGVPALQFRRALLAHAERASFGRASTSPPTTCSTTVS
jgi:hypothetical protein